jgi:hypothetical protein
VLRHRLWRKLPLLEQRGLISRMCRGPKR